jgi:hypothetical protein
MQCGNCHQPTHGDLLDCPCRLGPECPIQTGVCPRCARTIRRNAEARDGRVRPAAETYPRTAPARPDDELVEVLTRLDPARRRRGHLRAV